jgi:hypothetical protein
MVKADEITEHVMKIRKIILLFCAGLWLIGVDLSASVRLVRNTREKVYVHTDRSVYIAGESVFLKIYIINESSTGSPEESRIVYMVLRNKKNDPVTKIRFEASGGTAYGRIMLPDTLSTGPYQIAAYTNRMRNSVEASFFSKEIIVANRFDRELAAIDELSDTVTILKNNKATDGAGSISLAVIPDKIEYNKREKVNLLLRISVNEPGIKANISVSVFEYVPGMDYEPSICSYLSLTSTDSLYLNDSGRLKYMFLPETGGEILQGRVIDADSGVGIANAYVYLSAVDTVANLQYSNSDTNGLFRFLLKDYYKGKDLFLSVRGSPTIKDLKIEPEDKFKPGSNYKPSNFGVNPLLKDYLHNSQDIVTVQKIYRNTYSAEALEQNNVRINTPALYYKPSYSVYPGEFVPLNDFVDMAREILPPQLRVRKQNEKYHSYMADEYLGMYLTQEPAIFLDGVLIDNIEQIIHLGTDKVSRVDLVSSRYSYGYLELPGILAVFSRNREIENLQPFPSTLRLRLDDYQPYSVFKAPEYIDGNSDDHPDFRQLLYWNPEIVISKDSELMPAFYTSDHSGIFIIRVEGISSDGFPISATARIRVN